MEPKRVIEFKVGGDPPGGCVRRYRGHGRPVEAALAVSKPPVVSCIIEPGPPTRVSKPSNLFALIDPTVRPEVPKLNAVPEPVTSAIPNYKRHFSNVQEPPAPLAPEVPVAPRAPIAPLAPVASRGPIAPLALAPVASRGPIAPLAPVASRGPIAPLAPVASWRPVAPLEPVAPRGPVAPLEPVAPRGPVAPLEPVAPRGPVAPLEPVATRGPVAPLEPVAPRGPVVPREPVAPRDALLPPVAPREPIAPEQPTSRPALSPTTIRRFEMIFAAKDDDELMELTQDYELKHGSIAKEKQKKQDDIAGPLK